MRLVIQRVSRAKVEIEGKTVSEIGAGLMILVGVEQGDTPDDASWLARKASAMRIFDDENGVMNRSVSEVGGEVLAVSQFTLTASTKRGTARATSVLPATSWPCRFTSSFATRCRY